MQFCPPGDEHMCSKHLEARKKLIVKQKFCTSSWLITEINILRCRSAKRQNFFTRTQALLKLVIRGYAYREQR